MVDRPPQPRPSFVITITPLTFSVVHIVNHVFFAIGIDGDQLPGPRVTPWCIICGLNGIACQLDGIALDINRDCDLTTGRSVKLASSEHVLSFLGVMK